MRPFAGLGFGFGVGFGRKDTSEDVSCVVPGCETSLTPDFPFGRRQSSAPDPIVIGGVSYAISHHLLARGVARLHVGGEELTTMETTVELGVRF